MPPYPKQYPKKISPVNTAAPAMQPMAGALYLCFIRLTESQDTLVGMLPGILRQASIVTVLFVSRMWFLTSTSYLVKVHKKTARPHME